MNEQIFLFFFSHSTAINHREISALPKSFRPRFGTETHNTAPLSRRNHEEGEHPARMIPVASSFITAVLIVPAFDDVSIGHRPTFSLLCLGL